MLNPALDPERLATEWAREGRLRIEGLLEPHHAEEVEAAMATLPYDLIFFLDGRYRVASQSQLAGLSPEQRRELHEQLRRLAIRGTGFLYAGYRMDTARRGAAPPVLQHLFETINGDILALVRRITGIDALVSADGQFTRFEPGHYLTRHSDAVAAEHRRVAYVLGMTREWHPDWGGLLQFFADNGEPRDAWVPRFNSLALFDVRHVHSVTFVTPFAAVPRHSLTGWFRDDLPE